MESEITFIQLHDWTVLPRKKNKMNVESSESDNIRYSNRTRVKGKCHPYKIANEFGWLIHSPFDINIEPVEDEYQIKCKDDEILSIGTTLEIDYWIKREQTYIGIRPSGWFRIHQAKIKKEWTNLFIPNGEKSFEWRLGFGVKIPKDFILMFLPVESQKKIKVHHGILTKKHLDNAIDTELGISMAFDPLKKTMIKKDEVIGRIIIINKNSLNLEAKVIDYEGKTYDKK